jgi:hypothetical protein
MLLKILCDIIDVMEDFCNVIDVIGDCCYIIDVIGDFCIIDVKPFLNLIITDINFS